MKYMLDFILLLSSIPLFKIFIGSCSLFLLVGNLHIIQKGTILVKKLETEVDLGMYQESGIDCPFFMLIRKHQFLFYGEFLKCFILKATVAFLYHSPGFAVY